MQGRTQVTDQTQVVDEAEDALSDPTAKIKCYRHQEREGETDHANTDPERPIRGNEWDQGLPDRIRQVAIEHQDRNVQTYKGDRKQGDELVKVVGEETVKQTVKKLARDRQTQHHGKPQQEIGYDSAGAGHIPPELDTIQGKEPIQPLASCLPGGG